jgi:hypothetical protein
MLNDFIITDRESCVRAIRNGGIAALFSAFFTTLVGVAGIFIQPGKFDQKFSPSPLIFLDALLVFILAIFVFRKNRAASVILVLYFSLSKIIVGISIDSFTNIIIFFLLLLYYFSALRGTFIWHSKYREIAESENH